MQLASTFASKDYWGILRGKIPPDSLLASAITWGSLLGMMPDPLLSSQFSPHRIRFWRNPTNVSSPREEGREYGGFHDSSSPFIMSVAHDYIPVSCGYSVNTNLALLLAQLHDVVPVTDDPAAVQLLNLKYLRAKGAAHPEAGEISGGSVIARRTPEYFRKYNIVGVNVVEALVPHDDMTQRSFKEILDFRQAERESFERFQTYLRELVAQIESEPWSASLETEVIRMLDSKVIPASVKIRDEMTSAYEKMFGGVIKKTAATVTPTLAASVFSGLSPGQVLTLSCAAVAGALSISLPDLTDLWQEGRQNKRNGLSFLVRFASG